MLLKKINLDKDIVNCLQYVTSVFRPGALHTVVRLHIGNRVNLLTS